MVKNDEFPDGKWDAEVGVEVVCLVRAKPGSHYEEEYGRMPIDAAMQAIRIGFVDLSTLDGFADLEGEVIISHVSEMWE